MHAGSVTATASRELAGDPASPYRWCDLGEDLAEAGQHPVADYCFRRAVALGPNIPEILLRAGNYHFAVGDSRRALAEMRGALALEREYDDFVFSTYRRMGVSVAEATEHGLSPLPAAKIAFLRSLLSNGTPREAEQWWALLKQAGETSPRSAAE